DHSLATGAESSTWPGRPWLAARLVGGTSFVTRLIQFLVSRSTPPPQRCSRTASRHAPPTCAQARGWVVVPRTVGREAARVCHACRREWLETLADRDRHPSGTGGPFA